MKLSDALDSFISASKADGLAQSTLTWYSAMLKPLKAVFGMCELTDLTTVQLREYIIELRDRSTKYGEQRPEQQGGLSSETVASHIRALHRFWRWAALEYDIKNPMERIKRPQRVKQLPKGIIQEDFTAMLRAAADNDDKLIAARDVAMILLLADTGCRAGGLLSLSVKDVNLQNGSALVTEKGDRLRRVYFLPVTRWALALWSAMRPVTDETGLFLSFNNGTLRGKLKYAGLYQALKRVALRAGVKGRFNPHSFRHAFARDYLLAGGDLATLAQLLGHSSVEVTAYFYAIFEQSELQAQHNKFSPVAGLLPDGK